MTNGPKKSDLAEVARKPQRAATIRRAYGKRSPPQLLLAWKH
jgi:hypothetical protein